MPVVDFHSDAGRNELLQLLNTYLKASPHEGPPSESMQHLIIRTILENQDEGSCIVGMGARQMHFDKQIQKDIYGILAPKNYMSFLISLAHPFSRGTVHVSSSSPRDPPVIDPRYLSHPLDVEILARHVRYIPTIAST